VFCGEYKLDVTLAGYTPHTENITILETGTTYVELIEIINDPTDPKAEVDECNNALFTWNHEAEKSFIGFTVYLDGEVVKTGIQIKEYLFVNLPVGKYVAGVEANYGSGNSEIVNTAEFEVDCVGIPDIGEGNYTIYPNPTKDLLFVQRAASTEATIEVYNAMGMFIDKYDTSEIIFEINVSSLAAGTYFIRVTEGDTTGVKSFVKQ
jgi:hypothetical protein